MRILIEDKDIVVSTHRVFDEPKVAALYLMQICADWSIACGNSKRLEKELNLNEVRMRNIGIQLHKGLLGPGDEATFKIDGMKCAISILEDAGKHTGPAWNNRYAFGPLTHEDSLNDYYNGNQGWENRVDESRPIPYGVGHAPDGTEY